MDRKMKAKWVHALRSGKYAQGRRWMRVGNKYCCLGVLREVCALGGTNTTRLEDAESQRVGLSGAEENALVLMNDGDDDAGISQHSFSHIADWIEANL